MEGAIDTQEDLDLAYGSLAEKAASFPDSTSTAVRRREVLLREAPYGQTTSKGHSRHGRARHRCRRSRVTRGERYRASPSPTDVDPADNPTTSRRPTSSSCSTRTRARTTQSTPSSAAKTSSSRAPRAPASPRRSAISSHRSWHGESGLVRRREARCDRRCLAPARPG